MFKRCIILKNNMVDGVKMRVVCWIKLKSWSYM